MAFTEFTIRSGGSNLYAGSLDGSAEASTTPLVTYTNGGWNSGTGVFTPASGDPVADGVAVGHWASVYTDGSGGPTGFVARVTARTTTTITLSTTAKSGTAPTTAGSGITVVVGGAWAGPSGTSGFPFGFAQGTMTDASSNAPRVNFKNDQTYSVTAAMTHNQSGSAFFQGYTSTFGDSGRATIDGGATGSAYTVLTASAQSNTYKSFVFQNNGNSGSSDLVAGSSAVSFENCVFTGGRGSGLHCSNAVIVEGCEAYGNNISNTSNKGGFSNTATGASFSFCISHDNTGSNSDGFSCSGGNPTNDLTNCIADTNGGVGLRMYAGVIQSCVAYGNASSGAFAANRTVALNSIFSNNGAYGFDSNNNGLAEVYNCAFYSNTSGATRITRGGVESGSITLTGNPFTDAANGDFRLNNTSGAGAACRGTGIGTFTQTAPSYSGTIGYPDVGAVQHQETTTTVVVPCAQSVLMVGRAGVSAH